MADTTSYASYLVTFMLDAAILAGSPLAIGTVVGLVISFFQAITQIQDQTLSQTVKIVSIVIALLAFGTVLTGPLLNSTQRLFENFHMIVE